MTHKQRGTIVVDACELQGFGSEYSPDDILPNSPLQKLQQEQTATGTYFDLLLLLAGQGYKIIIPELAAYEAGKVLSRGKSVNTVAFPDSDPQYPQQPKVIKFLERVNRGVFGDSITIEAVKANYKYAVELEGLREDLLGSRSAYREQSRAKIQPAIRGHVIALDSKFKDEADQGEQQAIDIIADLKNTTDTPIFFLSPDFGARVALDRKLENKDNVGLLTSGGLLLALANNVVSDGRTLLSALGLDGVIGEHWDKIRRSAVLNSKLPRTAVGNINNGYYDSPLTTEYSSSNPKPFSDAMAALGKEMDLSSAEVSDVVAEHGRVAAFEGKFGKVERRRKL